MKGLILAGGRGTRLLPLTLPTSKQLLPVYDKPMIFYPITSLIRLGIREIGIISTPTQLPNFHQLLGDGSQWGLSISLIEQPEPLGIAQAILEAVEFLGSDTFALILGDNLFDGIPFETTKLQIKGLKGARIFGYKVADPSRYGVIELNAKGEIMRLIEKPSSFVSNVAVPGLYFFDNTAIHRASTLEYSERGELEITNLLEQYLTDGALQYEILPEGSAWLDTGTIESMFQASEYVKVVQDRQGRLLGSPEQSSFEEGFLNEKKFTLLARGLSTSAYGQLLLRAIRGDN